jgi:hypothetical protein
VVIASMRKGVDADTPGKLLVMAENGIKKS